MDDLKRLVLIEEVKALKARYCRALDHADADTWGSLLTDDVTLDARGSCTDPATGVAFSPAVEEVVCGKDAVVTAAIGTRKEIIAASAHQVHMPEIEIIDEDNIKAIWPMFDLLAYKNGSVMNGFGHYHETYRRIEGHLRIQSIRLTRLRVEFR